MSGTMREFMATIAGDDILHLTAIGDKGVFAGRSFDPCDLDAAEAWVLNVNRRGNAYFTVNAPGATCLDHKLNKTHIGRLRGIWADLDPDEEIEVQPAPADDPAMTGFARERNRLLALAERLPETDYPPSFVIDSGNGIQALWLFNEAIEATVDNKAAAETLGKRIEATLGGDATTSNVDRVLRLPDTVNWPNAKKRAKGRASCRARLLHAGPERYALCDLADMAEAIAPELRKAGLVLARRRTKTERVEAAHAIVITSHHLDEARAKRIAAVIRRSTVAAEIWRGDRRYSNRSARHFAFICALFRAEIFDGFNDDWADLIAAVTVALDKKLGLPTGKVCRPGYLELTIGKALAHMGDDL